MTQKDEDVMDKKAVTRAVKGGHVDQDVVIRMWDGHAAEGRESLVGNSLGCSKEH